MGQGILGMKAARRARDRRGFSLIEVLISMTIGLTVTLAILGMFNHAYRIYAGNRRLTVATNLASQKLSDFKTMTVAAIKGQNPKTATEVVSGVQYTLDWTVADVDVDGDSTPDLVGDVVKVQLDVKWTHGDDDHRVSMATMTTGKPE